MPTNQYVVIAKSRPDCRNPRRLAMHIKISTATVSSRWYGRNWGIADTTATVPAAGCTAAVTT